MRKKTLVYAMAAVIGFSGLMDAKSEVRQQ